MKPIVLIHGYSAESKGVSTKEISAIYGTLPSALKKKYGAGAIQEVDVSRYVSLEDGVTVDDLSRALERALRERYPHLIQKGFHAIVHSTGALVIRNWLRRFSKKPSPLKNLIYMAGANFGSGWAHVGKGQVSKWGRMVFQGGAERGVQVLEALELGSDWTLDLHVHFLRRGRRLQADYGVYEHVIIGSQTDMAWLPAPVRYAREDGSDGVVRVSASNVNHHYLLMGPTEDAQRMSWSQVQRENQNHLLRRGKREPRYRIWAESRPGMRNRPEVPFAIPFQCAHSGDEMGVVSGSGTQAQVLALLDQALKSTTSNWSKRVDSYRKMTEANYQRVRDDLAPSWFRGMVYEPRAQYDPHAMVVFRLRDQDGRPVQHYDIYFEPKKKGSSLGSLIEHRHINGNDQNIIAFYLRTNAYDKEAGQWQDRLEGLEDFTLEITATEPQTDQIVYLPLRFEINGRQLKRWVHPHRTTVVDVEMLRVPAPEIFDIRRA